MLNSTTLRRIKASVVAALVVTGIVVAAPGMGAGPYSGGPTHWFTTSAGDEIALSVVFPKNFDPSQTYPAIFEMAGYENGSASPSGRTMLGQTKDALCEEYPDSEPCQYDPPLATDSHDGTSAFRYTDDYVVVHASLPGTGCSSGEFNLYSFEEARAGAEVIDDWIVKQEWSNGKVGILGHSYGGATGFLIAAHQPEHLVAMTVSGLIDDVYRGITFPGGILNTLFPPAWYLGIRNGFDVLGGSVQGIARNADNDNNGDNHGLKCAENTASHRRSLQGDAIYQGVQSGGVDNQYWRDVSLITYVDRIQVPIHIAGTFQDEQTGARGFTHLWEKIPEGVPKRLLMSNGDHDTNVEPYEMWADRKAWMDHFMRNIAPDPSWGWTEGAGSIRETSVRTLFELQSDAAGNLVSGGRLDTAGYPLEGTTWTDYHMCAGKTLTTDLDSCGAGSDSYFSGTGRQSWLFQAGYDVGPPVTTADGPDQIMLNGPVVEPGETWAISGPITANLYLSVTGQDTDLFVQVADEDAVTGSISFLQRGWLKASHRAIDAAKSDYSDVDPGRPGHLFRPWRPHTSAQNVASGQPIPYLVEIWPVAHVFRPGHRLVVIVTAPPAIDSNYSFAVFTGQPVSENALIYANPANPSKITLPVVPVDAIEGLGTGGPGCPNYWAVRCVT